MHVNVYMYILRVESRQTWQSCLDEDEKSELQSLRCLARFDALYSHSEIITEPFESDPVRALQKIYIIFAIAGL